jgi:predicted O-methyltransferase YrrM
METLRLEIEELGSGDIPFFGGKYKGGIYLQQLPKEISQCIKYLMENDKPIESYLEIGSAAGGTAYIFNKFFDINTTVLIDNNSHRHSRHRVDVLADIDYVEFVGNSQSTEAFNFVNDLGCTFDVVLIDGDHEYPSVSQDVENFYGFVSPGGYLILHDTDFCDGVKQVFDGIKASGDFASVAEFVDHDHWHTCGIGVIKRNG